MTIQYTKTHPQYNTLLVEYYPTWNIQQNIFVASVEIARFITIKKIGVGAWSLKSLKPTDK